jgi:hypothetical protein
MLTVCSRKPCGTPPGKAKCPVETLNAQEARASIAAGEDLTNRQVRALRDLWLMPSKNDDKPKAVASVSSDLAISDSPNLDIVAPLATTGLVSETPRFTRAGSCAVRGPRAIAHTF